MCVLIVRSHITYFLSWSRVVISPGPSLRHLTHSWCQNVFENRWHIFWYALKLPFEGFPRWGTHILIFIVNTEFNAYSARHSQSTSFPTMLRYFSTTNGSMFRSWRNLSDKKSNLPMFGLRVNLVNLPSLATWPGSDLDIERTRLSISPVVNMIVKKSPVPPVVIKAEPNLDKRACIMAKNKLALTMILRWSSFL